MAKELEELSQQLDGILPEDSMEAELTDESDSGDVELTDGDMEEAEAVLDDNDVDEESDVDDEAEEETDSDQETSEEPENYADDEEEVESEQELSDELDGELDGSEYVEFDDDDLETLVLDPHRGDVLPIAQLLKERVTRDEWRSRMTEERTKIRDEVSKEYEQQTLLANERAVIEQEFTSMPIEFLRGVTRRGIELGIIPHQFAGLLDGAVQNLESQGLYNHQQAVMQARSSMQERAVQQQQAELGKQRAQMWLDHQDMVFRQKYGKSFFELPEQEQLVVRGAFQQSPGSPNFVDLYERIYGAGGTLEGKGSGINQEQPIASQVVRQAPTASPSRSKVIQKLRTGKKKRGVPAGRSGGAASGGKRRESSVEELSGALDRQLSLT